MQDMECRMETMHMGRMIHMLSHQLKRRNIQEELMDEGLTGSQRHIMKFILLRTLHTDVYQKDIEEEFRIRKSTVTFGKKWIHQERKRSSGCKAQAHCADSQGRGTASPDFRAAGENGSPSYGGNPGRRASYLAQCDVPDVRQSCKSGGGSV